MTISVFNGVENIVGKEENCLFKQFLLFPQCFQKASFSEVSKGVIVWEWVNYPLCGKALTHSHTMTPFDAPWETSLLKTLWEKEKLLITSNFSFFHSVFYLFG